MKHRRWSLASYPRWIRERLSVFGVDTSRILLSLEGRRPALGQQDRIAFALDVAGIPVHLIEEQEPGGMERRRTALLAPVRM
jgi:hypothetical protein